MSVHESLKTDEFLGLIESIRKVGQEIIAPNAGDVDEKARFPVESFAALKELKLLSAYVPQELGGMGLDVHQIAKICEVLGHYCGSTAMIYSMHKIQVACISHHCADSTFFKKYLQRLAAEQRLIASATTEIGIGGDLRSSICAVEREGKKFTLEKKAPVISYGEAADDLIITARRTADSAKSDQVHVLVHKDQYTLEQISGWDTMGFRGTCSSGYVVNCHGGIEQIIPIPFADILSQTMHPFAHITWSSLWSGIAADAVNMSRGAVKNMAKKNLDGPHIASIRLAEVDSILQSMRHGISDITDEYADLLRQGDSNAFTNFGFSIRVNNLKLSSSTKIVEIVGRALLICGISSYRNDSPFSLCRHLRDSYGAALMVNNDRIMLHNSTLLLMHKE